MVMMMMKSNIQNQYAHKVSLSNIHESLFQSSPFYLLQLTKKKKKTQKNNGFASINQSYDFSIRLCIHHCILLNSFNF